MVTICNCEILFSFFRGFKLGKRPKLTAALELDEIKEKMNVGVNFNRPQAIHQKKTTSTRKYASGGCIFRLKHVLIQVRAHHGVGKFTIKGAEIKTVDSLDLEQGVRHGEVPHQLREGGTFGATDRVLNCARDKIAHRAVSCRRSGPAAERDVDNFLQLAHRTMKAG